MGILGFETWVGDPTNFRLFFLFGGNSPLTHYMSQGPAGSKWVPKIQKFQNHHKCSKNSHAPFWEEMLSQNLQIWEGDGDSSPMKQ